MNNENRVGPKIDPWGTSANSVSPESHAIACLRNDQYD